MYVFSLYEIFLTLSSKRNGWIEHDFPEECHFLYLLVFHACFSLDPFWSCELFHFSGIYSWKSGLAFNNRTCYGESIHICEGMYSNLDVCTFLNFHVDFWIQIGFFKFELFSWSQEPPGTIKRILFQKFFWSFIVWNKIALLFTHYFFRKIERCFE